MTLAGGNHPRRARADLPPAPDASKPDPSKPYPRIGLALGGGSARGWAHIGVIRELVESGIVPDVVCGTSIGAVVGACHAAGKLDALEAFARGLNRRRVLRLMDLSLSGAGLLGGARLKRRLDRDLDGVKIEDLPIAFAAIATELGTGREICLSRGDLVEAVRASYALPGIFQPVRSSGRWLFDGAMSNPVPVSVARSLGADFVIAVNLTAGQGYEPEPDLAPVSDGLDGQELAGSMNDSVAPQPELKRGNRFAFIRRRLFTRRVDGTPGIAGVMVGAFAIAQERISHSRLAIDPPDATIHARLGSVGLFDFHRAAELIAHGRAVTRLAMPGIETELGIAIGYCEGS